MCHDSNAWATLCGSGFWCLLVVWCLECAPGLSFWKGGKKKEKEIDWSLATGSKTDKSVPNLILKLWEEQNHLVLYVSTVVVMLPVALKLCKKTSDLFFEVPGVCGGVCRTCISWQLTILASFGHGNCFTLQSSLWSSLPCCFDRCLLGLAVK